MHTISTSIRRSHVPLAPLIFITIATGLLSCAPNNTNRPSRTDEDPAILEQATHQACNVSRRSHDLDPLRRNQILDAAARKHSQRMAKGQVKFGHRGAKRRAIKLIETLGLSSVAENVARNRGHNDPVEVAMKGWMASRGHRRNLLSSYDLTGIGVAKSQDGTIYFTQIFGRSL